MIQFNKQESKDHTETLTNKKKMKKIILLTGLVLTTFLLSCSSDEGSGSNQLAMSMQNITGKWYITQGVKPDGTIVDYNGQYDPERDYVEIFIYHKITSTIFYSNGVSVDDLGCTNFILNNDTGRITLCNDSFNGVISNLTVDTMRIDYDETQYVGGGVGDAKAIIFSRQ